LFPERIKVTLSFVREILAYAAEHASEIREVNEKAERATIEAADTKIKKGVRFRMVSGETLRNMPSYEYAPQTQPDGSVQYRPTQTKIYLDSVRYFGQFEATVESTVPTG